MRCARCDQEMKFKDARVLSLHVGDSMDPESGLSVFICLGCTRFLLTRTSWFGGRHGDDGE